MSEVVFFAQHSKSRIGGGRTSRTGGPGAATAEAQQKAPSSGAERRRRGQGPSPESEGCRLSRQIASAVLAIPVEEIARANRGEAEICTARHVAMYLAHVIFQVPLTIIGADFGRDRTSVAHAIRRVEDQRDRADFDAQLTRLEALAGECRALLDGHRGAA